MNKIIPQLALLASLTAYSTFALVAANSEVSWLPGETAPQHDERMAWWRETKFGMFIHWGIYSIPADGEWHMRQKQMPFAEYSKFAAQFNPVKFNADQWMSLAHDAGMKYLVFTTKHHDGFAMFKSEASAYNIVDATPFRQDIVKELAAAAPKHDIRFGTYYSFLADWGHQGGGAGCPHWDPAFQDGDLHEYIKKVALPQLRELLTHYGPLSVMWFDSDGARGITPEESAQVVELLKTQPQLVVNPRLGGVKGDFATAEQHMPALRPEGDWELNGTVNGAWGYTSAPAKPLDKLLPYMITAWGMGGNVLMNVGPTAEGLIPTDSEQRLREVGNWLKIYGESIYGTTAGPFTYLPWGTATRKGGTVYLHIFDWPVDGNLTVPLSNEVKSATLLGAGNPSVLQTTRKNDRLIVHLPQKAPDAVSNVVALEIEGEPQTNYLSVLRDKPVTASSEQKTAAAVVDADSTSRWRNDQPTGWLEIDAGQPVTVATLRVTAAYSEITNCALEYKAGGEWKARSNQSKNQWGLYGENFPARHRADFPT